MKRLHRTTAKIVMTFLLLSLILSACSSPENPNTAEISESLETDVIVEEMSQETTEPPRKPLELPDVKYDGYDFRIVNINQSAMTWVYTAIDAEEETGDAINDAVYIRNRLVEDRFNITLVKLSKVQQPKFSKRRQKAFRQVQTIMI